MEFDFAVNSLFPKSIVKLGRELVPEGSSGSRRDSQDIVIKVSHVLDEMGRASAEAQGLTSPITSAERLRNSNYTVYLFTDPDGAQGKGCIVGLLKVGKKNLFLFDETGAHYEIQALCVLDFYIHESKQRIGYGLILYEYMLREENVLPQHLAIDRPSLKFLKFMQKHYKLEKILPQSNNFVVFDGFFTNRPDSIEKSQTGKRLPAGIIQTSCFVERKDTANMQLEQPRSPPNTGRYAAYRPPSTMGKILQTGAVNPFQQKGDEYNLQHIGDNSQQFSGRFEAYNPPSTMTNLSYMQVMQRDDKNSFQRDIDSTDTQHVEAYPQENIGRYAANNPHSTMAEVMQTDDKNSFQHNEDSTDTQHVEAYPQENIGRYAANNPHSTMAEIIQTDDNSFQHNLKTKDEWESYPESPRNSSDVCSNACILASACSHIGKYLNGQSKQ